MVDLKAYYEKNKNLYKIQPQRKLRYVLFSNQPSEDTMMVVRSLENIVNRMESDTMDFKELIEIYSGFLLIQEIHFQLVYCHPKLFQH